MPRRNGSKGQYHEPGRKAGTVARRARKSVRKSVSKKKG